QAAGHVERVGRGRWRLTPASSRLAEQVATWRRLEERVRPWGGGWVGVATGGLGRIDRGAVRRPERGLSMFGLAELRPGLHVRPDNRAESLPALRIALCELGLEPEAPVFSMGELGSAQQGAMSLWDGAALGARYEGCRASLGEVRQQTPSWTPERAAREMF